MRIAHFGAAAATLTAGIASTASAIELTDFFDPNTSFEEAYVDFNADANSGNQDQTSYDALLNAFYTQRDSTDRRVLTYRADSFLDAQRGPSEGDNSDTDFGVGASVNRDTYFNNDREKLFYFLSGAYAHRDSAVDDNLGAAVGIGYGRVWNATPLAKSLRVQEAMLGKGLLAREMDDDALLELARIIGLEDEYRSREGADTYRGVWYADMEAVLVGSGVLNNDSLSALATVTIDEVLFDEPISARRHGWLVRAGVGIQSSDFAGVADNDAKLTFQGEYAKPFGLRGQLIDTVSYEPVFADNTLHSLSNRLSYSYEISNRIDWINSWRLILQQADDSDSTRFTSNTLSSTFLYHLTNQLDLGVTLAAFDNNERPNTDRSNDDVATSAVIGVRYRVK